jgi:hypothetical protein
MLKVRMIVLGAGNSSCIFSITLKDEFGQVLLDCGNKQSMRVSKEIMINPDERLLGFRAKYCDPLRKTGYMKDLRLMIGRLQ